MMDWNKRFIELAKYISLWSKDRSTKYGAIITDKNHRILSTGYNGFPSGCNDDIDKRHERPIKYFYSEHAERNAIYSAARAGVCLFGCTLYVNGFPCADCARAIIQSGITMLVCYNPEENGRWKEERWKENHIVSREMLNEVGIDIIYLE